MPQYRTTLTSASHAAIVTTAVLQIIEQHKRARRTTLRRALHDYLADEIAATVRATAYEIRLEDE
jgi:hypothetical protein